MELFFIVLRNIFIALAILYALVVIIALSFFFSFRSILHQHDHELFMNLANKKDACHKLVSLLNSKNIKIDRKKVDVLNNFDIKKIEHQEGDEAKQAREKLAMVCDYFLSLCHDNKGIAESNEFILIENSLNELNSLFINQVAMYNADILGYNFWITFYPTRYIFILFKVKKKNLIF